jgi:hypothetical protein
MSANIAKAEYYFSASAAPKTPNGKVAAYLQVFGIKI